MGSVRLLLAAAAAAAEESRGAQRRGEGRRIGERRRRKEKKGEVRLSIALKPRGIRVDLEQVRLVIKKRRSEHQLRDYCQSFHGKSGSNPQEHILYRGTRKAQYCTVPDEGTEHRRFFPSCHLLRFALLYRPSFSNFPISVCISPSRLSSRVNHHLQPTCPFPFPLLITPDPSTTGLIVSDPGTGFELRAPSLCRLTADIGVLGLRCSSVSPASLFCRREFPSTVWPSIAAAGSSRSPASLASSS